VVLGNSSSGILEAPAALTPTVNVGDRQRGRLKSPSVIDCDSSSESILSAIRQALSPEFQAVAARGENPFGRGEASIFIKEQLKLANLKRIIFKEFYNLEIC
jgi:UDP-N-acetylglucosamine 2-epimerase (non-hydrolysing)/GDP/UDP-N,N'-diacetylbacillosamine 2-epimerase (hydrolysing)